MSKINELSAFQRNLNSLTLYLYLMNTRCKHLQDYDDEGDTTIKLVELYSKEFAEWLS